MTTLHDLLGVHRDADKETLKWAFRQTLAASRPDPSAGDADTFLQSAASNGILRDPEQRMVYCRLIEWERERLRSQSRRVAVAGTIIASFAILLGTIAGGYGLFASDAPTGVVATVIDDGSSRRGAVVGRDDETASAPSARKDAAPLPTAPAIKRDLGTLSDAETKRFDDSPAPATAVMEKADDVPVAAAVPVKRADDAPAPAAEPPKKTDDATTSPTAQAKRADDIPAPAAEPVKKAEDTLTIVTAVSQAEGPSTAVGELADTAPVQPAVRAEPTGQESARNRQQSLEGLEGRARPGANAATTNGGGKVALGFPSNETAFRNDARHYRERGIASYRRGDFLQAISDLDEAIRLDHDDAQAFNLRGNVADELGAFERALSDYDEAIRLDPNNAALFDDRAILLRRKGDIDKALLELDRAVRSGLADAKTYCDRGLIWYGKGSFDRATADFNQAIKLDAVFSTAYIRRGALLHRNSEFNVPFTAVYPAIRVDPKIFDVSRRSARRPVPQPAVSAGPPESRAAPADFP